MTDVVFEDASASAVVDSYAKSPIEDTFECLAYWSKEVLAAGSPAREALVRVAKKKSSSSASILTGSRWMSQIFLPQYMYLYSTSALFLLQHGFISIFTIL